MIGYGTSGMKTSIYRDDKVFNKVYINILEIIKMQIRSNSHFVFIKNFTCVSN